MRGDLVKNVIYEAEGLGIYEKGFPQERLGIMFPSGQVSNGNKTQWYI